MVIMDEFFRGGSAGAFAVAVSYPIDTIKTRIQLHHSHSRYDILHDLKVLRDTNKGSIVKGLYRGVSSPLVAVCLEKSVLFSAFDHIKKRRFLRTDNVHVKLTGSKTYGNYLQ